MTMEHDWKGAAETARFLLLEEEECGSTRYNDDLRLLARVASALASGELVLCKTLKRVAGPLEWVEYIPTDLPEGP